MSCGLLVVGGCPVGPAERVQVVDLQVGLSGQSLSSISEPVLSPQVVFLSTWS